MVVHQGGLPCRIPSRSLLGPFELVRKDGTDATGGRTGSGPAFASGLEFRLGISTM